MSVVAGNSEAVEWVCGCCGCCKWCLLLLLAEWCEGFCNVRVSEALAAYVVLVPSLLPCWKGRVYTVLIFDRVCLVVCLWFQSQGIQIGAICWFIPGNSSCIIGRPGWIRVCWVLFGAWLLGRRTGLLSFRRCCSLRLEGKSQVGAFPVCVSAEGVQCLVVPLLHDSLHMLVLTGRHHVYLVGSLLYHLSSSVVPVNNHCIYNGMTAA